jgi:uncharacterized protein YkwD
MAIGLGMLLLVFGPADSFTVRAPQAGEPVGVATNVATSRRSALVIGNAAYEKAPLDNPVNDASDMAETLMQLGFEVTALNDASRREMEEAIETFSQKLRQGGVGLFYYAGHGVQIQGENYLIPVGSRINREQDVKYEAVPVGRVMGGMEDAGNDINIVILDACRDNPFARSVRSAQSGLASLQAPRGSLIAYATSPGAVAVDGNGRNSFYTQLLLEAMRTPGMRVEQVFKQVRKGVLAATNDMQTPWESSSLVGDFYFVPQVSSSPSSEPDPEVVMWSMAENSSNLEDIQEFLDAYPDGRFAPAARLKLKQLRRQQPKEIRFAMRKASREETKIDAGTAPASDMQAAEQIAPREATNVHTEGVPEKAMPADVGASSSEELKVAALEPPPATQHEPNRKETVEELLRFEALDQKKLQTAICSAANAARVSYGLPALTTHSLLEQAAQLHAQRMVSHNFFAHEDQEDPNLRTLAQRARHVGVTNPSGNQNIAKAFGIQYQSGETVYAIDRSAGLFSRTPRGEPIPNHTYQSFAESVVDQWMASQAIASLLSKHVVQTGCGVAFYWDEGFPIFNVVQVYQYYREVKQ